MANSEVRIEPPMDKKFALLGSQRTVPLNGERRDESKTKEYTKGISLDHDPNIGRILPYSS